MLGCLSKLAMCREFTLSSFTSPADKVLKTNVSFNVSSVCPHNVSHGIDRIMVKKDYTEK